MAKVRVVRPYGCVQHVNYVCPVDCSWLPRLFLFDGLAFVAWIWNDLPAAAGWRIVG